VAALRHLLAASDAGGTQTDTSVVSFKGCLYLAAVAVREPAEWPLMAAGLAAVARWCGAATPEPAAPWRR
jgi:hypothetical protein